MKNKLLRFVALLAVTALMISYLEPLDNMGSKWLENLTFPTFKTEAASTGLYSFNYDGNTYNDGAQINYTNYKDGLNTLKIILKCDSGIPSGTAITWTASNDNIIQIDSQNDDECSVTLKILSPGYSGLSVSLKINGTVYASIAYCIIHVPLQWTDDDTKNPNILATTAAPYGLMIAQNGEITTDAKTVRTLQLYTGDSGDHPGQDHFLRKVRYVQYGFKDTAAALSYGMVSGSAVYYVPSSVKPEDLTESVAAISWESSDTSVLEVDSVTGVMKAVSAGFARVTVTTNTINESTKEVDSISFNVVVVPEATVVGYTTEMQTKFKQVINPTADEIVIQSNAKYADTLSWKLYRGDNANAASDITKDFKSSIDISPSTGRVVLTGLPAGVYYLTAIDVKDSTASKILPTYDVTAANIQYLGIVLIVPIRFPVDTLILNYYNANVFDSYDLLANSNLPDDNFRFTSDEINIATVGSKDGVVEAKGLGDCHVIISVKDATVVNKLFGTYAASAGALTIGSTGYTVDVSVVNGVAISSTSETLPLGSNLQLTLTAPNPYEGDVVWKSSNEKVVTVDETGLVTAVGTGDTYVTVKIKVNGVTKQAKCKIKVVSSVNDIVLSSKQDFVEVGDNLTISATVSPKLANATLSWSVSDPTIASIVDPSALALTIKGEKEGTVVVSAVNKENAIVATKIIKVVQEITGITLSDSDVTLAQTVGFYQLYATCTPALPDSQKLTWTSSNKKVVTVDQNGKVYLVKPGTAVITVTTENGLIAQCNFTVTQGITDITFDENEITILVGEKHRLTYVIKPANASNVNLSWSSLDSKICTVDASGYVVGKNVGACYIFAEAKDGSGKRATCKVNVIQNIKQLKTDITSLSLPVGDTYQLEVSITPANASDTVVFECSNSKIAEVNKKGKILAKSKGTCVIVVSTANKSCDPVYINVDVWQPVTGISLDATDVEIKVGEERELVLTIAPKNATFKEVAWTSSNDKVVSVDEEGVIKGISGGMAFIEVHTTDDELGTYTARCVVNVIEYVADIKLQEEAEVGVGKKLKLVATIDNQTATNKDVTWKSSNKKIAKVNSKGVVTGVKEGKCRIIVTAADGSGASAECELRVITATESIDIDPTMTYIELLVGETKTIQFEKDPSNATYPPAWTSSEESIAIVNKKGMITGIKAGTTTVIATAPDNPEITGTIVVKVINPVNATNITLNKSEIVMIPGETQSVVASFQPGNITEEYTWSSDNSFVATVDAKTGTIIAKSIGTANITIMTKQSGKKANVTVYVVGLSETSVTLYQYESLILGLELDGQAQGALDPRWGTDNQSIAVISKNGSKANLTGKATGTTNVYVMVNGRKLTCKVKVIKNLK